jgi:hypothetical protein
MAERKKGSRKSDSSLNESVDSNNSGTEESSRSSQSEGRKRKRKP